MSPGLAAVQQRAQNALSVDLDLGIFRQLLVGPYSLGQNADGSSFLNDAPVKLGFQRKSIRDRRANVYEVMDNIQFMFRL